MRRLLFLYFILFHILFIEQGLATVTDTDKHSTHTVCLMCEDFYSAFARALSSIVRVLFIFLFSFVCVTDMYMSVTHTKHTQIRSYVSFFFVCVTDMYMFLTHTNKHSTRTVCLMCADFYDKCTRALSFSSTCTRALTLIVHVI